MSTMNMRKKHELDSAEACFLLYMRGIVDVNFIANLIDASAAVLEPECVDTILGPLQLGKMPDKGVGENSFETGLSPLENLQWCISEFVLCVPDNRNDLVGAEGIYLWFCLWYCKRWACDDAMQELVATVAAAIELADDALIGLLAKYLRLTLDVVPAGEQHDCDGLRVALRVLNASITLQAASLSNSARTCITEGVLEDVLEPELKAAWAGVVKGLVKNI